MDRKTFLATLAGIPLAARIPLSSEIPVTEAHYNVENINVGGACLIPQYFRAALDFWGEDCEIIGHPAQKLMWNQARLLMGNPAYSTEWNEAQSDYFMGREFKIDLSLPMNEIHFRRNGKIVGRITALAIPVPYHLAGVTNG